MRESAIKLDPTGNFAVLPVRQDEAESPDEIGAGEEEKEELHNIIEEPVEFWD